MGTKVTPFLMFQGGQARAAVELYTAALPDGRLVEAAYYGPEGPGAEGTIVVARLSLAGQEVMVSDSPVPHAFGFTPSSSLFVDCASEAELERLAATLGEGGEVLMPLGDYGFSRRFTWLSDRFGVSWQLNLP